MSAQVKPIGTVLENATPHGFVIKVNKGQRVPLHEYVMVEVHEGDAGRRVLAEVVQVSARNPLAREGLAYSDEALGGGQADTYELAGAEVLGYLDDRHNIRRPKTPPLPNSPVYPANDAMMQKFYEGDPKRIPLYVAALLNKVDVRVPIHLQEIQFHLGIFAQTRGGKSYMAGRIMEEIASRTPFPIIVIDIHGDYVMMDKDTRDKQRHGDYHIVVWYPLGTPRIPNITAEIKELTLNLKEMGADLLIAHLPRLGPIQESKLKEIWEEVSETVEEFGLPDIIAAVQDRIDDPKSKEEERKRMGGVIDRLKEFQRRVGDLKGEAPIKAMLSPHTINAVCLRGLRARVQDAYTSLLVELLFRHQVDNSESNIKAPPTFLFVEEAHRVAAKQNGGRYASEALETAIREGAKFKLYLVLISQRPRSIDPNILANVGNYIVLRITNQQDQSNIESAAESFSHRFVEDLPNLNQGEAVFVGPFVPLPALVTALPRRSVHRGATPDLYEVMQELSRQLERRESESW